MHDLITEELGRRTATPGRARGPAVGATLGPWRLDRLIADGGCGSVYRGHHVVLGRPAAIKVLHPALADDPAMVARFVGEAQAVNRIRHPSIVDVFDVGSVGGQPYLVMELLAEHNLEDLLDRDGRFTLPECRAVIAPVCAALSAAHAAGFVHRDVKARNIGFTAAADPPVVKLLDFGIAKLLAPDRTAGSTASVRVGTPHCVAPEQIRGQRVDPRTDVYALGVLLYHLATGIYPFDADDSTEVERMHLDAPPPRPSAVVPTVDAIDALVAAAMAKDPAQRPASAQAFADALAACVAPPVIRHRGFRRRATASRGAGAGRWRPAR